MTQRTKAELDDLFATTGLRLISAARLRDLVESCIPSTGGLHFDDPGTPTPIAAPSTWTKVANVSSLHSAYRFDQPLDNRLRYTGAAAGIRAVVTATLSFTCATNNQVLAFAIFVNGVIAPASVIRTKIAAGADVQAVTITAHPTLDPNDYIEVFVANDTSDADVTVEHGHVHVIGFLA